MRTFAELLRAGARARASGASWAAVAAEVKRSIHTVRAWPRRYAEQWSAALAEAENEARAEALAEATSILRRHMRDKDAKISMPAAKILFERLMRAAAQPNNDEDTPFADFRRQLLSNAPEQIDEGVEHAMATADVGRGSSPT